MRDITRRRFIATAGQAALGAVVLPGIARANPFSDNGVNCTFRGRALRGMDVVSYHTERRVVRGFDRFGTAWRDAMWCFSTPEHQAMFEADPRAYAPQYGGYCAYAMSRGRVVASDPKSWNIRNGLLYLYMSDDMRAKWRSDIEGSIARADAAWPKIVQQLAG